MLFDAIASSQLEGFITASSTTDIFYICRKQTQNLEEARQILTITLVTLSVGSVDRAILETALKAGVVDFEDAFQIACAEAQQLDAIVTKLRRKEAIASATNQMARLVEDLLLLARTDATTATPTQAWNAIPLEELLEDAIEFLEPKAEAKDISLKFNWKTSVSVMGDAAQLIRLFSNLVENALQYTPSGGVVTLSLRQIDKFAIVSVEDTGIGIDPEHLPLIFDRFWRADRARSYRSEGSGLGLAIGQAIAVRHGGDITVSSQLGVGSCFKVRLPVV
jgi:signal transduction histidine kinase